MSAVLDQADFDLPMTEELVARVHRGVRRRRLLRVVAASCAVLAVAGAATLVIRSAYGPEPAPPAVVAPAEPLLDGFRIDYVPAGLTRDEQDSSAVYAVSENRLHNDDVPPPADSPDASVALRIYLRDNGGMMMSVSVLRPESTTDSIEVARWLTGWAISGEPVTRTFEVPAGQAQVTGYQIVIGTPDHAVIVVQGNAAIPTSELERVAANIRPS